MNLIIFIIASLLAGTGIGFAIFRFVIKGKYNKIKKKKLLEVKEEFLNKKSQLEKEVQQRNQHLLQAENKLKQREMNLVQRQ